MKNLKKLLPGGKREPKVLVVFSNSQQDCDRLIRYMSRHVANLPVSLSHPCLLPGEAL